MLQFLMLGFNPNVGFLFSPFRKSKEKKKNQWNPLRVIYESEKKKQTLILCGKMCLYFLFLENLRRFVLTAQNWHAKRFVLKEGIAVLKYQLLKTEKYARNTLGAAQCLPEPSVSL